MDRSAEGLACSINWNAALGNLELSIDHARFGPASALYQNAWTAMTRRKALTTTQTIRKTVRLASASTCGLGSRLGLNLWRRFCGAPTWDGLFPAAMAVSLDVMDFRNTNLA